LPARVADEAVSIVNSGPVGGLVAARHLGALLGAEHLITTDMGGTSFDVSLIANGVPAMSAQTAIDFGMVVRAPMVEKRDAYERAVRAIVAAGVKSREFARCDASLVTRAMLGAVNWTARWYRPDGPQKPDQIADALSEYLVKGLA